MDFSDMFSNPFGESSGLPSINGIAADFTSFDNIISGSGSSSDYGRGVGAGVGAYFGQPQLGADIGASILPILNHGFHDIWDSLKK